MAMCVYVSRIKLNWINFIQFKPDPTHIAQSGLEFFKWIWSLCVFWGVCLEQYHNKTNKQTVIIQIKTTNYACNPN